ncbi:hypothetical protein PPTG_23241 [Phytophthora nicotianae INRA-310]|uniref:Uncharacterized protein n=1 Tax=Phytophthora nicotianae (strain INRA-310) TaxID=761204 RepID=W2Q3S0_PHYN3|nr:hypothetical protein PPTG_23241 [Phytophthora nicotianae INRA-310]ETN07209.1 hypothetical protein PPTG_23241 [Phytophthora nicotianae INRA-310]
MTHSTVRSMLTLSNTIAGDLPPSSSEIFFMSFAASVMMLRPVGTLPVKATLCTSGCETSEPPASAPKPLITFRTPAGKPTSAASCASCSALNGVISDGLSTTVQPAARAGANFQSAMSAG